MEYLTKYPFAVPIKSKSAEEIAKHFFHYISMFGAPKIILTDNGKEFVNNMLTKLTKLNGIEHRVTSVYRPNVNGLAESFNKIVNAIRKHAELDTKNWPDWINYVLMAYRSRKHSITKFPPFSLMFGRTMLLPIEWHQDKDTTEDLCIFNRSLELKKLFEEDIKSAKKNIESAQEVQKVVQDRRNNIEHNTLKKGTNVMVRVPLKKIQGKMQPKAHGPYKIDGTTRNDNYWLKNYDGKRLQTAYPRDRLQVVDDNVDGDEHVEVEKIINHRIKRNKYEYLVKWRNFPDSHNEWLDESRFDSTFMIERRIIYLLK